MFRVTVCENEILEEKQCDSCGHWTEVAELEEYVDGSDNNYQEWYLCPKCHYEAKRQYAEPPEL